MDNYALKASVEQQNRLARHINSRSRSALDGGVLRNVGNKVVETTSSDQLKMGDADTSQTTKKDVGVPYVITPNSKALHIKTGQEFVIKPKARPPQPKSSLQVKQPDMKF